MYARGLTARLIYVGDVLKMMLVLTVFNEFYRPFLSMKEMFFGEIRRKSVGCLTFVSM